MRTPNLGMTLGVCCGGIVPEKLKESMLGELSVHWDVDETDEKQWKYVDGPFK
ncbi:hypothetical protein D8674_008466 [Pyrus ussuriensis x Pyrus communis]|uniref:Uncharacterized protein n=1 Tax=Pyrus ussuriensis x Pyrus communis TaxID=2448454 RepID=A0A5N5HVS1_9ROSA|nr:hypothetical protein D8674_008466 [Pyrus ussuriensis x Pyrus communis]